MVGSFEETNAYNRNKCIRTGMDHLDPGEKTDSDEEGEELPLGPAALLLHEGGAEEEAAGPGAPPASLVQREQELHRVRNLVHVPGLRNLESVMLGQVISELNSFLHLIKSYPLNSESVCIYPSIPYHQLMSRSGNNIKTESYISS